LCGVAVAVGAKFCPECGTRLAESCAGCGAARPTPTARFCPECGTPFGAAAGSAAPADPAARPAPVAERRLVSILFADLVGFTTIAEGRDPEETRELLTRYFDLAREVVEGHGGVVEKFIGDAVMAIWGAPVAREDDPERAVRGALELVDAVRTLGPEVQARAAVLTGEAAVTLGAVGQGMVAGDLVNTASRVQSVALPGTVLVGDATRGAAERSIVFEAAGEHLLKGKAVPVPVFRAVRVVAERGGGNRSETLEAPFVGRDEELRLLKDFLHATSRERRARLVSVTGQAGIGKSRLAWEFLKYIDGLIEDIYWHEGRCPAYGEGVTFWALGEMIRSRAGLVEGDDPATTRAKVRATVDEWVPDATERVAVEPALLALLGVEAAPPGGREELFPAWRTFFERIADRGPVAMVFEDLHWADPGLLDFIDHLLEWARSAPIYVVTLARPELLERRPTWGAGKRSFVGIPLEPLPEPAMRQLLAGLVPGLPERAVRAIVERADGIPLYAVETVRKLVAEGRLVEAEGAYEPVGDLSDLAVPETLQALIAARLDALDAEDRAIVCDAAVLGQSFTLPALAAISDAAESDLGLRLDGLVRRELLVRDRDPRSPELGQYRFVQGLIREVAYGTLARRDRRLRHLAAARHFEAQGDEELAPLLAAHYLAAFRASAPGEEAEAAAVQARISLRAAAARATALGSPVQALALLREALTVTTDAAETLDLLEQAGRAASDAGHHDAAEELLREATAMARETGTRVDVARTTASLLRALLAGFRSHAADELVRVVGPEFPDPLEGPEMLRLNTLIAREAVYGDARGDHGLALAERCLAAAERLDDIELIVETLATKGQILPTLGRPYEGRALTGAARDLADLHGLRRSALRAEASLVLALVDDDPREAVAVARDVIQRARRLGVRGTEIGAIANGAEPSIRIGDWDGALAMLEELTAVDLDRTDEETIRSHLVMIRALRGEDVSVELAALDALAAEEDDPQSLAEVEMARGFAAFASGDLEAASSRFTEALRIAAINTPFLAPLRARLALWRGDRAALAEAIAILAEPTTRGRVVAVDRRIAAAGLDAMDGRRAEALAGYVAGLREHRAMGTRWDLACAAIDMAMALGPEVPEVQAAGREARAILEELQAEPFLARLDAALAAPADDDLGAAAIHSPARP
jgi:class 3 adenylate cyclase/tetratricopeptide (TPR) repeat protein